MKKYFGTDGIRGIAGITLNAEFAMRVGKCLGEYMLTIGSVGKIIVGRDTRISGSMLVCAFASGVAETGIDVDVIGVIPSGGISYLTQCNGYEFGVVITSSHNPPEYNGIKIFGKDGIKLSEQVEFEIEKMLDNASLKTLNCSKKIGKIAVKTEIALQYENFLEQITNVDFSNKYYVIDCANGAGSEIAMKVFTKLQAKVLCINCEKDGAKINCDCGAVSPLKLSQVVKQENADLGFAFDGDADRLIVVSNFGKVVDGDDILCVMAKHLKENGSLLGNKVVGTIMSNYGLEKELNKFGVDLVRVDVGDRNVCVCIKECGYNFGGEQSGHTIFYDVLNSADAIISAIKVAELEILTGKAISEQISGLEKYYQCKRNIKVLEQAKKRILDSATLKDEVKFCDELLQDAGRIVVRASGTEPLIRIMVEGENKQKVEDVCKRIEGCIVELI